MASEDVNDFILIMAGGSGTRLWPLSTNEHPKQFIDVLGMGKSLLQITFERSKNIVPVENIYIVAPEKYKSLILSQLSINEGQIIVEPEAKNTAPCIYYACRVIHNINSSANLLVLPADHLILNDLAFTNSMQKALQTVTNTDYIITFGIKPSYPETGYGYIEAYEKSRELRKVVSFREKPNIELATEYLKSSNFLWNSGIFLWSVQTMIQLFHDYSERIVTGFEGIDWKSIDNVEMGNVYSMCPNVSIDYEIMEKANNIYVYQADFDWSDLGSWKSVHRCSSKDNDGNFINTKIVKQNVINCFINVPEGGKNWALLDLENLIIIESDETIMIAPISSDQKIKELYNLSKS